MTDAGIPSPGSTIAASEEDDHQASSPSRPDPRSSLRHVLDSTPSGRNTPSNTSGPAPRHDNNNNNNNMMTEDDEAANTGNEGPSHAPSTTTGGQRAKRSKDPAAAAASMYSGNKVRHLKKDDGEPLWRKDIQYDFLKAIFDDNQAVFTNSYEPATIGKQTFANLYIDAMARSSKTSKILRDKLLSEHEPAKNMAMVCLLVNLGRMNTTLNFFPEMRAQLRTYHAIPSLQAQQDPNSYKQLQDAPRLKSILKGASEDRPEPNSLEKIKAVTDPPRTNPVNLIFVLSNFSPKVTELHFPPDHDFYDLIMRTNLSSQSRARAFLWLMWLYLESDFTEEGAEENPFGPGVDYKTGVRNQGVPRFVYLTPDKEKAENNDTEEEIEFGHGKMRERKRIIEADQIAFQAENGPPKRGPKPKLNLPPEEGAPSPASLLNRIRPKYEDGTASPATVASRIRPKYESDIDSTRSTPPPRGLHAPLGRIHTAIKGRGANSLKHQLLEGSSPVAELGSSGPAMRRSRPMTAHQMAVEQNRNQRVEYIISRGIRKEHHKARKTRRREGAFYRALRRTERMPNPLEDSGDERAAALIADEYAALEASRRDAAPFRNKGFGGLVQLAEEMDDFGEEVAAYAAAFRRSGRRLRRWDGNGGVGEDGVALGVIGTRRLVQSHSHSQAGEDDIDMDARNGGYGIADGEGVDADETEEDEIDYEHQQRLEELRMAMRREIQAHSAKKKQKRQPKGSNGVVKEKTLRGSGVGRGRGRGKGRGGRGAADGPSGTERVVGNGDGVMRPWEGIESVEGYPTGVQRWAPELNRSVWDDPEPAAASSPAAAPATKMEPISPLPIDANKADASKGLKDEDTADEEGKEGTGVGSSDNEGENEPENGDENEDDGADIDIDERRGDYGSRRDNGDETEEEGGQEHEEGKGEGEGELDEVDEDDEDDEDVDTRNQRTDGESRVYRS